eukprot:gene13119-8965_t
MILTHNNNQNQHHYICLICNHRNLNAGVHNLTLKSKQQTPTSTQKDNNRKANQRSANAMLNPEIEFMPNTRNKSNPNTASPTSCHNLGPTKQQNNLSFQQKITNPTYPKRSVKQAPRHTQPQPLHLHTSEIEVKHHICPTINTTQTIQFQITTSNQQLRRSNTTNTIGTNGNYAHTKSIQTTTYTHTIIAKPHSRPSCNHIPWESSKPTTVTSQPPTAHATTSSTASASTARVYITNKSKPLGNSRKPSAKFLLKQITQHTNTRPTTTLSPKPPRKHSINHQTGRHHHSCTTNRNTTTKCILLRRKHQRYSALLQTQTDQITAQNKVPANLQISTTTQPENSGSTSSDTINPSLSTNNHLSLTNAQNQHKAHQYTSLYIISTLHHPKLPRQTTKSHTCTHPKPEITPVAAKVPISQYPEGTRNPNKPQARPTANTVATNCKSTTTRKPLSIGSSVANSTHKSVCRTSGLHAPHTLYTLRTSAHHHSTTSNRQNQRATKNASKPQKGTHKLTHGNPKPNKFNVPAINSEYGSNRCVSATSYQIRAT